MAFGRTRRTNGGSTVTTTTTTVDRPAKKPGIMSRLTGRSRRTHYQTGATTVPAHHGRVGRKHHAHHAHGTTATTPVHHHRRKTSIGDKVSGAMLKMKGSLTRRPGVKAAGTRRMHGTDGRGSRRVY